MSTAFYRNGNRKRATIMPGEDSKNSIETKNKERWEQYLQSFCDKHGQFFEVAPSLREKFVSVANLMNHVQKITRGSKRLEMKTALGS